MKSLCYIFSLMILALTDVPCKDAAIKYGTTFTNVIDQDSSQEHADSDICSPFCTCTCCTTPTVTQVQLHVINLPIHIKASLIEHLAGKFIDISLPVWQPPQLA